MLTEQTFGGETLWIVEVRDNEVETANISGLVLDHVRTQSSGRPQLAVCFVHVLSSISKKGLPISHVDEQLREAHKLVVERRLLVQAVQKWEHLVIQVGRASLLPQITTFSHVEMNDRRGAGLLAVVKRLKPEHLYMSVKGRRLRSPVWGEAVAYCSRYLPATCSLTVHKHSYAVHHIQARVTLFSCSRIAQPAGSPSDSQCVSAGSTEEDSGEQQAQGPQLHRSSTDPMQTSGGPLQTAPGLLATTSEQAPLAPQQAEGGGGEMLAQVPAGGLSPALEVLLAHAEHVRTLVLQEARRVEAANAEAEMKRRLEAEAEEARRLEAAKAAQEADARLGQVEEAAARLVEVVVKEGREATQQCAWAFLEKQQEEYSCPITQEVMVDPVFADDGHTYERKAIKKWLLLRRTSPITREPMALNLTTNIRMRSQIQDWHRDMALFAASSNNTCLSVPEDSSSQLSVPQSASEYSADIDSSPSL